jgi:alcohol dehydrogenase class IV
MIQPFTLLQVPKVEFGIDTLKKLSLYINEGRVLLVLGNTISQHEKVLSLRDSLSQHNIEVVTCIVSGEPSVERIDEIAFSLYNDKITSVVGLGGGSVLDSAKALSVMLYHMEKRGVGNLSVKTFLEGVGTEVAPSGRLPLVLIPSTAGTGSEATKNAVISKVGEHGFKKSLRDDSYLPDVAIIDPSLHTSLPMAQTAASALDALTQLMEAYVSTKASPFIDSLALPAIHSVGLALMSLLENEDGENLSLRSSLAYGAFISGVAIAHSGLTYVHGLSGPMGSLHNIPHGVACALLIAKINKAMVANAQGEELGGTYLAKMELIAQGWGRVGAIGAIEFLEELEQKAHLPKVATYGFTQEELVQLSHLKAKRNSPITLSQKEIEEILLSI